MRSFQLLIHKLLFKLEKILFAFPDPARRVAGQNPTALDARPTMANRAN
jgi:hypothetical protein